MIDLSHYPYTKDTRGWHMDDIHVDIIYRVILENQPSSIAEIGCCMGRSACAYVEAQRLGLFPTVHLIDLKISDPLKKLVATAPKPEMFIFHEGSSDDFRMKVEMAVIDGDHSDAGAAKDVGWATGWGVPWIILHDVSGYPRDKGLVGAWRQGNELRRNPHYQCAFDDEDRPGTRTWRGLLVAGPYKFAI